MSNVDLTLKIDKDNMNKESVRVNITMRVKFLAYKRWLFYWLGGDFFVHLCLYVRKIKEITKWIAIYVRSNLKERKEMSITQKKIFVK